ncbi:MAG TPA: prepilin-type N-terminal cleavage/methylation domain-containing protein [Phycisphaerales bacterium]|nr:prepilin-type N-terminal cleavage/methylation domain-containing protein [Phycisphaerales bacterium]
MRSAGAGRGRAAGRGFSLVEAVIVIVIIAMLVSVVSVVAARVARGSRLAAEQQLLRSLAMGCEQFKTDFGYPPPLVNDADPVVTQDGRLQPNTRGDDFLRGEVLANEPRHSELSLTYFLMGVLDEDDGTGKPIDGVLGAGLTAPVRAGDRIVFSQRGRTYPALFDPAKAGHERVVSAGTYQVRLRDRWLQPIRYYRWATRYTASGEVENATAQTNNGHNIPAVLGGNPPGSPELAGAQYAIVSAGPDQTLSDVDARDPGNEDNLTELGR